MELSSSFSVLGNLLRLVQNESSCSPWSFSAPSSEDLAWISNQVDPTRFFMIFHADHTCSWESRCDAGTPAPRGKIESVRTHSEVIEQFDSFSLLKLFFLVRNLHCWSRKAFPRQMTPQSREKTAKTAVFRHRWQAWKVVRSIAAVRQRPRMPRNRRCSSAFFRDFPLTFQYKTACRGESSDFQGLSRLKTRKIAQGSDDLSTLPLSFIDYRLSERSVCFWEISICQNDTESLSS